MARYVLRCAHPTDEEMSRGRSWPALRVLDEMSGMLLVTMEHEALGNWQAAFPDWTAEPERQYPLPNTRVL